MIKELTTNFKAALDHKTHQLKTKTTETSQAELGSNSSSNRILVVVKKKKMRMMSILKGILTQVMKKRSIRREIE